MVMHVYITVVHSNRLLAKKLTVMTWQKLCLVCSFRLLKKTNFFKKGLFMEKPISTKMYACGNMFII